MAFWRDIYLGSLYQRAERNYRLTLLSVIGVSLTLSLMSNCLHDVDVDQRLYTVNH